MIFDEDEHVFIDPQKHTILNPDIVREILDSYKDDRKNYDRINKHIASCMKRLKSPNPYAIQARNQNTRIINHEIQKLELSPNPVYVCAYCESYGSISKNLHNHLKECVAAQESNFEKEDLGVEEYKGYIYRVGARVRYLCVKGVTSQPNKKGSFEVVPNSNDIIFANSVIFEMSTNLFIEKDSGLILNPYLNDIENFLYKKRDLRYRIDSITELMEICMELITSPNYYKPDSGSTVTLLDQSLKYCKKQNRQLYVCRSCEKVDFPRDEKATNEKARRHLKKCNKSNKKPACITVFSNYYDISVDEVDKKNAKHHLVALEDFKKFITLEQFEQSGSISLSEDEEETDSQTNITKEVPTEPIKGDMTFKGLPLVILESSSESSEVDEPERSYVHPSTINNSAASTSDPNISFAERQPLFLSSDLAAEESEDDGYLGDDGLVRNQKLSDLNEDFEPVDGTNSVSHLSDHQTVRDAFRSSNGSDVELEKHRDGEQIGKRKDPATSINENDDLDDFPDFDFGNFDGEVLPSSPIMATPPRVPTLQSNLYPERTGSNLEFSSPRQDIDKANTRYKRTRIQLIPINTKKPRTEPEVSFLSRIPLIPSSSRLSDSDIESSSDEELATFLLSSQA